MESDSEDPHQQTSRFNSIFRPSTCRLCLKYNEDSSEIVGTSKKETDLIDKISKHLHMEVFVFDDAPVWICKSCKESIETFDEFSCTVMQMQEHLQSILATGKDELSDPTLLDAVMVDATVGCKRVKKSQKRRATKLSGRTRQNKTVKTSLTGLVCEQLAKKEENESNIADITSDFNNKLMSGSSNNIIIKTESTEESLESASNLDINSTPNTVSKDDDLSSLEEQDWVSNGFNFDMDSDDDHTWKPPQSLCNSQQNKRKKSNAELVKSDGVLFEEDSFSEIEQNVPGSDKKRAKFRITATHGTEPKPKTPPGLRKTLRAEMHSKFVEFYGITCDICVKKFRDNSLPEEPLKYSSFDDLSEHMRKEHNERGYVKCCNSTMRDRKRAERHMLLHTQPGSIFKCNICGKQLSSHQSFRSHILLHLPDSERPHQCNQCERGFVTKTDLSNHERQHLPEEQRYSFTCDICGSRFCYEAALSLHKQRVHENYRPHLCDLCPKSFKTRSDLDRHKEQIHGNVKREQCPECGKWFKGPSILKTHMRQHKGQLYKCQFCDKTYSVRSSWKAHLVNHSDEKPHKCPVCEKCFKLPGTLKMHLNQHTGDLPYACQFCPKRFASSGNYYTHRKRMHREQLAQIKAEAEAAVANGLPPPVSLPPARTESISEAIERTKVVVAAKEKDAAIVVHENSTLNLSETQLPVVSIGITSSSICTSSLNSVATTMSSTSTRVETCGSGIVLTQSGKMNLNSPMPLAVSSLNSGNTPIQIVPSLKNIATPALKIFRIVSPDGASKLVFVKQDQSLTGNSQFEKVIEADPISLELCGELLPENVEPASIVTQPSA